MDRLGAVLGPAPSEVPLEELERKIRLRQELVGSELFAFRNQPPPKKKGGKKKASKADSTRAQAIETELAALGFGSFEEMVEAAKALKEKGAEKEEENGTSRSGNG